MWADQRVVHDLTEVQMIRDLPIAERRCYLSYRARRFKCEHFGNAFVERVGWKRTGVSYTERYERHIYQRIRRETVSQVVDDEGLSEEAAQAIFAHKDKKTIEACGCPKVWVLYFDEITLHQGHGKFVLDISAPELGLVLIKAGGIQYEEMRPEQPRQFQLRMHPPHPKCPRLHQVGDSASNAEPKMCPRRVSAAVVKRNFPKKVPNLLTFYT